MGSNFLTIPVKKPKKLGGASKANAAPLIIKAKSLNKEHHNDWA